MISKRKQKQVNTLREVSKQLEILAKIEESNGRLSIDDVRRLIRVGYTHKLTIHIAGEKRIGSPQAILYLAMDAMATGGRVDSIRFYKPWQHTELTNPNNRNK